MSHIDDLIRRLCPDGVEFKTLGEVFEMKAGRFVAASDIADVADAANPIPVLRDPRLCVERHA
jgi:hypothetical protein